MGIPPITIVDAVRLYDKVAGVGADELLLLVEADNQREFLHVTLRCLHLLGDQLVKTEQRVVELADANDHLLSAVRSYLQPAETSVTWTGPNNHELIPEIAKEIAAEFASEHPKV